MSKYMKAEGHLVEKNYKKQKAGPIAIFLRTLGLTEALPILTSALALAGDHVKAASELGIPLWCGHCLSTRIFSPDLKS